MYEYTTRKTLSKIGYQFNGDDLEDFEAEYLTLIASEFAKLEKADLDKKRRGQKKKSRRK